jgi:hypothetical protein
MDFYGEFIPEGRTKVKPRFAQPAGHAYGRDEKACAAPPLLCGEIINAGRLIMEGSP